MVTPRGAAVFRLAAPFRAALQRFSLIAFVGISLLLLILQRAEVPFVEKTRNVTVDVFAPLVEALSSPILGATRVADEVYALLRLRTENAHLRQEIERLREWRDVARRLDVENQSLRALVNYAPPPGGKQITGRIVADAGGAYVRNFLLAIGSAQGVVRGLAAVSGEGFIGRVTDVGERTARVLLITDLNSKIPVVVGARGERAILVGDNSALPRLLYLSQENTIAPGDLVATSGHGGLLPPGLPIGVVEKITDRGVNVRPLADWQRLKHVRLLDYALVPPNALPVAVPSMRSSAALR